MLFLDSSNLSLKHKSAKKANLKINVNGYDRMVQAVSKFLETPFLTLTAKEFDEIQKNIALKSNFNAE